MTNPLQGDRVRRKTTVPTISWVSGVMSFVPAPSYRSCIVEAVTFGGGIVVRYDDGSLEMLAGQEDLL